LKPSDFISLLEHPKSVKQEETASLKSIISAFPYFQSARILYLKSLKDQDSFKYNNELKVTAAYTSDRSVLFDFISSDIFNTAEKETIHRKISEKMSAETESIPEIKEELSIGKPLSFTKNETRSFSEWLQLSVKKPIGNLHEKTEEQVSEKTKIIDRFIQNNPRISPLQKDKNIAAPIDKNTSETALMTETLAKVYLEQKKYENAIRAYEILSLKYPEKSGFFADQIKRVQILQKNKL